MLNLSIENFAKKKGFTLAEVLITIGIIGIVSALTIPILMTKLEKIKTQTRLKKTYALLTNAVRASYDEVGEVDEDEFPTENFSKANGKFLFDKYFAPYLKVNYKYSGADCVELSKSYGPTANSQMFSDTNGACYNLLNGTSIIFWAGRQTTSYNIYPIKVITTPNKVHKVDGRDGFSFYLTYDEKGGHVVTFPRAISLTVSDDDLVNYCGSVSSRISLGGYHIDRGAYCSELLMRNGWTIPKNYPVKF